MKIPYWPGHRLTVGGRLNPEAVRVHMIGVEPRVSRLLSWPGGLIVIARYDRKRK